MEKNCKSVSLLVVLNVGSKEYKRLSPKDKLWLDGHTRVMLQSEFDDDDENVFIHQDILKYVKSSFGRMLFRVAVGILSTRCSILQRTDEPAKQHSGKGPADCGEEPASFPETSVNGELPASEDLAWWVGGSKKKEPCQEAQLAPGDSPEEAIAERLKDVKNGEDLVPEEPQKSLPPQNMWETWARGKNEYCQEAQLAPANSPENAVAEPLEDVNEPLEEPPADVAEEPVLPEPEESPLPPHDTWSRRGGGHRRNRRRNRRRNPVNKIKLLKNFLRVLLLKHPLGQKKLRRAVCLGIRNLIA
ncbi:hypothetical protein RJZ56_000656 [Blastomyces dermatitidis]